MTDPATHDERTRRCPRLGHEVSFGYCRKPAAELPCRKIADCWWEQFDVQAFLRENYTEAELAKIFAPPQDKVSSLVDLIRQAQAANKPKP